MGTKLLKPTPRVGLRKCVPIVKVILFLAPRAEIVVLMRPAAGVALNRRPATQNIDGHEPSKDDPGCRQPYKIA